MNSVISSWRLSHYRNRYDVQPSIGHYDLDGLIKVLTYRRIGKKDGVADSPGIIMDPALTRETSSVAECDVLFFDLDDGSDIVSVADVFGDVFSILTTTHNHRRDDADYPWLAPSYRDDRHRTPCPAKFKGGWRIRLAAPLAEKLDPDQYRRLASYWKERLNSKGCHPDVSKLSPEQLFYRPSRPPEVPCLHEEFVFKGKLLSLNTIPQGWAPPMPLQGVSALQYGNLALPQGTSDQRRRELLDMIRKLPNGTQERIFHPGPSSDQSRDDYALVALLCEAGWRQEDVIEAFAEFSISRKANRKSTRSGELYLVQTIVKTYAAIASKVPTRRRAFASKKPARRVVTSPARSVSAIQPGGCYASGDKVSQRWTKELFGRDRHGYVELESLWKWVFWIRNEVEASNREFRVGLVVMSWACQKNERRQLIRNGSGAALCSSFPPPPPGIVLSVGLHFKADFKVDPDLDLLVVAPPAPSWTANQVVTRQNATTSAVRAALQLGEHPRATRLLLGPAANVDGIEFAEVSRPHGNSDYFAELRPRKSLSLGGSHEA